MTGTMQTADVTAAAETLKARGVMPLAEADPEVFALLNEEDERQRTGIELIASENFTSRAVMECLGSCLTNKYSEGLPGARYYGGNEVVDKVEKLAQKRALEAFQLDSTEWGVNVQPYSGSPANMAAYVGLLSPHDRIMGLDLPCGGHLTHGFYTPKKKVSATSVFFESMPYRTDSTTGLIDFEGLRTTAMLFRPKLIIAGTSAYPRTLDFAKFRAIADEVGAMLMADIAHIAGLVASGLHPSPFPYCDVVTTTTHKTLRGPRSGVMFYNVKKHGAAFKDQMDSAVFPSLQGGPHNHQVAAIAVQMKEVASPEFRHYSATVVANSKFLAKTLMDKGCKFVSDGTDNHLLLWDLRNFGISGAKMEKVCEAAGISLNKNTVPGDASALSPSGVRIGTPAMTSRGCGEKEWATIAVILMRCVGICKSIQDAHGKKLVDFNRGVEGNADIAQLRKDVATFASTLSMPGRRHQ